MNVCLQDETLLFSSLNVIENADCTFNTTFQDHQYKVGVRASPVHVDVTPLLTRSVGLLLVLMEVVQGTRG